MRYRAGLSEPQVNTLARLVLAARRIAGKRVKASDFYDLGESEPLNRRPVRYFERRKIEDVNTRLEATLLREHVRPTDLANKAGLSRQALRRLRRGQAIMTVSTLAQIVRAFRRMGRDVKASDIADVGDG